MTQYPFNDNLPFGLLILFLFGYWGGGGEGGRGGWGRGGWGRGGVGEAGRPALISMGQTPGVNHGEEYHKWITYDYDPDHFCSILATCGRSMEEDGTTIQPKSFWLGRVCHLVYVMVAIPWKSLLPNCKHLSNAGWAERPYSFCPSRTPALHLLY